MTIRIHATYEDGVLRPSEPLDLPEATAVDVIIVDPTTSPTMETAGQKAERGARVAAALERLAALGPIPGIEDPSAWQREIRRDRELPGRDQ